MTPTTAQFAQVTRPDIVVSSRASREAIDTQLDLEKMLWAAVIEQCRYFREVSGRFLQLAKLAFHQRSSHIGRRWFESGDLVHLQRVAEIFAATRVLGRVRIRKEVGLPVAKPEFAEVLQGVGVDRAVEYLKSLPVVTQQEWRQLMRGAGQQAFTAAGVESKAATEALRNLVAKALGEGWSEQEFNDAATELLKKFETEAGALRTLWNTTTANAMAKGREEELNSPEVMAIVGYRLYDAILDLRTRWNHAELDGGIAPGDWPGWLRYAPPNGYNCRCTLIGITDVRAKTMLSEGLYFDLTEGIPLGAGPDEGFDKAA
jgi:SPP1 gp7 family putative phage head morphogenesis protein